MPDQLDRERVCVRAGFVMGLVTGIGVTVLVVLIALWRGSNA